MRLREMKYADWGITEQRLCELLHEARKESNRELLKLATVASDEYIAPFLQVSLISPARGTGKRLETSRGFKNTYIGDRWNRVYPTCKADDFYAYRRVALFMFNKLLKMEVLG